MAEIVYVFNGYDAGNEQWTSYPARMVDGIQASYAYTNSNNSVQKLTSNTCLGINLGTITNVEVRAYGYGDGNDSAVLRPVWNGGPAEGNNHKVLARTAPGWSTWQGIFNDTGRPSSWTWAAIANLDLDVQYMKSAKPNPLYVGMVQIRVTYTSEVIISPDIATVIFSAPVSTLSIGSDILLLTASLLLMTTQPSTISGTVISPNVPDIIIEAPVSAVVSGTGIIPQLANVTIEGYVSLIIGGISIDLPVADIILDSSIPLISSGANIDSTYANLSLDGLAPQVISSTEVIISPDTATILLTAGISVLSTGYTAETLVATMMLETNNLTIAIGTTAFPSIASWNVTALSPQLVFGIGINPLQAELFIESLANQVVIGTVIDSHIAELLFDISGPQVHSGTIISPCLSMIELIGINTVTPIIILPNTASSNYATYLPQVSVGCIISPVVAKSCWTTKKAKINKYKHKHQRITTLFVGIW